MINEEIWKLYKDYHETTRHPVVAALLTVATVLDDIGFDTKIAMTAEQVAKSIIPGGAS